MPVRLRLAIVTVLVAGGAVATAFFVWPRGNHDAGCSGATVMPLSAQGQKALDSYGTDIRYDIERLSNSERNDTWADPVTGDSRILSFDSQGRLTSETGLTWAGKTLQSVTVSFNDRSWNETTTIAPDGYSSGENGAAADSLHTRMALADGTATALGHAVIDGHTTLELRGRIEQWVDPLTYLPVRTRAAQTGGGLTTDDITWLPRNASNLLSTRIVVPRGFTRVKEPALGSTSQIEVFPAGCAQS